MSWWRQVTGTLLLIVACCLHACAWYLNAGSKAGGGAAPPNSCRPAVPCPAAMAVAEERGEGTPLQPAHIHAAYQRLVEADKVPGRPSGRRPFL